MDSSVILDCIHQGCKLIKVDWISNFWLLKNTHFVWLEALTRLVNNTINVF